MKTKQIIYPCLLLALLGGCQQHEEAVTPQKGGRTIFVETTLPGMEVSVKSREVSVGTDLIYAYPFQVDPEFNGVAVAPDSLTDGRYSYYLPQEKEDIIFTNVLAGNDYQVIAGEGNTYLRFILPDTSAGSASDLVVGTLAQSAMNGEELYTVPLKRVVSELTIGLTMVRKNGTPVANLAEYLTRASLSVSSFYTEYAVNSNLQGTYTGERSLEWSGDTVSAGVMARYPVCESVYVFPSFNGAHPVLTLSLEAPDGQVQVLSKEMSHPIEANKHYKLTLQVRQTTTEFGLIFDEFAEEDITVDDFEEITGK